MPRPPITALITSYNEADLIEGCLSSLQWTDEILLLDSFSKDGTADLVREKFPHVRLIQREYLGSAAQKNFGMDTASHDWILIVDSDEQVPPELRDEILQTLENPKLWAYWIHRRNFVLGKEIRHSGLQRDGVRRLFHREHARYPNRRVHTDLAVDGPVGKLKNSFLHYYIRSFDHFVEKMTRYGVWGGAQLFIEKRPVTAWDIFSHSAGRFFRDYVVNLGFLDGARGLITVGLHTYYTFWKYSKLWELHELERAGLPVPLPRLETEEDLWKLPWEQPEAKAGAAKEAAGKG